MKRFLIMFGCMLGAQWMLRILCDAPLWGAVVGGWVFWAAVRPKEWM